MIDNLFSIGIGLFIVFALAYLAYMVGLIMVLKRLHKLTWLAFVPLLNFYAQVRAIGAPARWFFFALPPYIGAVYAGSVAIRLGAIFNRGPAFSVTWLTLGAPIGMFMIARSKEPINQELLDAKPVLLDIKALKHHRAGANTPPN